MKLSRRKKGEKLPIEQCIRDLIKLMVVPLVLVIVAVVGILFWYGHHYNEILNNVTTASEFNQNFKEDIDSKMYYYVIESSVL